MIVGQARVPENTAVYAIGDIHGRADLLETLLARIDADIAASPRRVSRLVFLGDYCDRGPRSDRVLEILCSRAARQGTVILRGNHDQAILGFLDDPAAYGDLWMGFGGGETLDAYGVSRRVDGDWFALRNEFRRAFPARHLDLLRSAVLHVVEGDYFFAHAGVRPGIALDAQSPEDLMWIRGEFLRWREPFAKVVVHGHTPVNAVEILPNRMNADTGAFMSGVLSCVVLEEARYRVIDTADSLGAARFGW